MRLIPQTRDDKITMYMKLTKRELAEMLINCNDILAKMSNPPIVVNPTPIGPPPAPGVITWADPSPTFTRAPMIIRTGKTA